MNVKRSTGRGLFAETPTSDSPQEPASGRLN